VAVHADGGFAHLTHSSDGSRITLEFGPVVVGQAARATLRLDNVGGADMTILNVTTELSSVDFSAGVSRGQKLIPGGPSLQIPVRFTPTALGVEQAMILMSTDAPVVPSIELDLVGLGAPR
jgi:hypothetical protein